MFACALPPENHQPKTLPKLAAFSCNKKIASSFTEFAIKTPDEDVPIFWPGLPPISTCLMHLSGWESQPGEKRWQNFSEARHPLTDV